MLLCRSQLILSMLHNTVLELPDEKHHPGNDTKANVSDVNTKAILFKFHRPTVAFAAVFSFSFTFTFTVLATLHAKRSASLIYIFQVYQAEHK